MELSRHLKSDPVSRLGPDPPRGIDADDPVAAAVGVMRRHHTGCLLVTARGRLVGIFTDRDLLTRVLAPGRPLDTRVRAVMTPDPVTVGPADPVRTAIRRMERGGYRHLPVVADGGRPVGILSARRVVRYIVEHFPGLVYNQPPPGDPYPEAPEGA